MNSAKTLLVVAVLAAIGGVSYMAFKEPPPPPVDNWTEHTDTSLGDLNARNSNSTGDLNPKTSGGSPPPWNSPGSPMDAGSQGLGKFDSGNQSFPSHGSGDHNLYGSRTDSGFPNKAPAGPQNTIPDSNGLNSNFGSQGEVNVPSPKSAFSQPAFGTGADSERARVDALGLAPSTYRDAMAKAEGLIQKDQLPEALKILSRVYFNNPKLSAADHDDLNKVLDRLAGTVIYSREGSTHVVRGGERLEDIARQHKVPWELLAKINGIDDPSRIQPGQKLKVVEGPFKAIISLEKRELTLMVQGHYAGRFPFDLQGSAPADITTQVRTKNSYGDRFIELDNGLRICGPGNQVNTNACTVGLSQPDIEDLFDILQVRADVVIRR